MQILTGEPVIITPTTGALAAEVVCLMLGEADVADGVDTLR